MTLVRNDQVTIRDVNSDRLFRRPVEILSTRTGMDLTTTMDYEVYIVPSGNTLVVVGIIFEATAATAMTVAPMSSLGIDGGVDDIFAQESLVDFDVVGEVWSNWVLGKYEAAPSGSSINLSVVGGTATMLTGNFYLTGFLL